MANMKRVVFHLRTGRSVEIQVDLPRLDDLLNDLYKIIGKRPGGALKFFPGSRGGTAVVLATEDITLIESFDYESPQVSP